MALTDLIPSSDLLKQVEGVEDGLSQVKKLGNIGWIGVATSLITVFVTLLSLGLTYRNFVSQDWPYFLLVIIPASFLFLVIWSRFYLKESQQPFRYTFSTTDLKPVSGTKKEQKLAWLSHDISDKLNERIRRLSLLEDDKVKEDEGKDKSHIHISGYYGYHKRPEDKWYLEVMPRVRIGPPGSEETLAHRVVFPVKGNPQTSNPTQARGAAQASKSESPPAGICEDEYERLCEWVYFSVASEIYLQIRKDVGKKIKMLPTEHFRAVAFLHEAEDYAKSNTLYAYDEAAKLYEEAILRFDPSEKPKPKSIWRLSCWRVTRGLCRLMKKLRLVLARIWVRMAREDVMCIRAEIGCANMLLYRRSLASLSGMRPNTIYKARTYVERAIGQLGKLPQDIPNIDDIRFDAYVTSALCYHFLRCTKEPEEDLKKAQGFKPLRAETDARYLLVAGLLSEGKWDENTLRQQLHLYQRAVENEEETGFEVAQFTRAWALEQLWRNRPPLQRNVAEMISREYREVLKINPGNIIAWANLGYMYWLLGSKEDIQNAEEFFEHGREYKEIKRETFIAELDYGCTRIAAERGDFAEAYEHYSNGVSALLAKGYSYAPGGYGSYWFNPINKSIMERFENYKSNVEYYYNLWHNQKNYLRALQVTVGAMESQDVETKQSARRRLRQLRDYISRLITQLVTQEDKESLGLITDEDVQLFTARLNSNEELSKSMQILINENSYEVIKKYIAPERAGKSIYAFVLVDYGHACASYYYQHPDDDNYLTKARDAYKKAISVNPGYVLAYYRLSDLQMLEAKKQMKQLKDFEDAKRLLEDAKDSLAKAKNLESNWIEGLILMADIQVNIAGVQAWIAKNEPQGTTKKARDLPVDQENLRGSWAIVRQLLPHDWIQESLDWIQKSLDSRDPLKKPDSNRIRELLNDGGIKWREEFYYFHVRALSKSVDICWLWPGNKELARVLTDHIRKEFWPAYQSSWEISEKNS